MTELGVAGNFLDQIGLRSPIFAIYTTSPFTENAALVKVAA
ncbi:hypothetical protein CKA32_004059 [Geitlerinema sp. FC II]|nr:hypothetical protein CKA32_000266 [Geitlerinema sp. FC II]PPT07972.1 hypothetical protein CKA32_004059 [Geitlerinema sp. FC II]